MLAKKLNMPRFASLGSNNNDRANERTPEIAFIKKNSVKRGILASVFSSELNEEIACTPHYAKITTTRIYILPKPFLIEKFS